MRKSSRPCSESVSSDGTGTGSTAGPSRRQSVEVAVVARGDHRRPHRRRHEPAGRPRRVERQLEHRGELGADRSAPNGRAFTRFSSEPATNRLKRASRSSKSACASRRCRRPERSTSQPIARNVAMWVMSRCSWSAPTALRRRRVGRAARDRPVAEERRRVVAPSDAIVGRRGRSGRRGRCAPAVPDAPRAPQARTRRRRPPSPTPTARRVEPYAAAACSRRDGFCMTSTDAAVAECLLRAPYEPPKEQRRDGQTRAEAPARRDLRRRIALVCSCETRDSVTPSTSPISRSVSSS